jgi:predicted peptidase
MDIKKIYIGLFVVLATPWIMGAQPGQLYKKELYVVKGDTLPYRIMWPEHFDETKTYPLVLFLHGAGERGNDNESQLIHGSSLFSSAENRERFPAIVIFPQCPTTDYWSNVKVDRSKKGRAKFVYKNGGAPTKALKMVMSLMETYVSRPYVDTGRIYAVGLSMGGMGTFEILARRPQMFAAAIPICGGGDPRSVTAYAKEIPLWAFHGAKDDVVDPSFSIEMVSAILQAGGYPRFSLFDTANHNSWDPAFQQPEFLPWLFGKGKAVKVPDTGMEKGNQGSPK